MKAMLKQEIEGFRQLGHDFLDKKVTAAEFKGKSGGMGVYAQRGGEAFMIRLKMPAGVVSLDAFAHVCKFAKDYHLPTIHLTTRQAIQLHDLPLDGVCDIMAEALEHDIYTRGGGGNFPRNVALSPLAGVDSNEAFDPTPFALLVTEHFLNKITTYHLPRKLKAAFSNNETDTANATIADLGFIPVLQDGKPFFRVYVAGGLGGGPRAAIQLKDLAKPEEVLYHVEALTQLFIEHGNYENKARARIRYIAEELGAEAFTALYQDYLKKAMAGEKLAALQPETLHSLSTPTKQDADGLIAQREADLYSVVLHPKAGLLSLEGAEAILAFVQKIPEVQLRLSMEESLYVRNLTKEQAQQLLALAAPYCQEPGIARSVCCIGAPTCQMGTCHTTGLLETILAELKAQKVSGHHLPELQISGCANSCARHQMSPLGLAGRKKNIDGESLECFELFYGAQRGIGQTTLGESVGVIPAKDYPKFFCQLAQNLNELDLDFVAYGQKYGEDFRNLVAEFAV